MSYDHDTAEDIARHERVPELLESVNVRLVRDGPQAYRLAEDHSVGVWRRGGVWYFKDRAGGADGRTTNVLGFLHRRNPGWTWQQVIEFAGGFLGVTLREMDAKRIPVVTLEERMRGLAHLYRKALPLDDWTAGARYLAGRGLLEVAKAWGVRCFEGGEPSGLRKYETCAKYGLTTLGRWVTNALPFLVYPATVDGETVLHRARLLMSSDEVRAADVKRKEAGNLPLGSNHWTPPGGVPLPGLWPTLPEELPAGAEIVLTEGESDAMAVKTLVPPSDPHGILGVARFIPGEPEWEAIVKAKARVILAFQSDRESQAGAERITGELKKAGVSVGAVMPACGAKDWAQSIEWGATPRASLFDIGATMGEHSPAKAFADLDRYMADLESGKIIFTPLPWPTLARTMGGKGIPPETCGLLSARTGDGKTWLGLLISLCAAEQGIPVFIVNTEMKPSVMVNRLVALKARNGRVSMLSDPSLMREAQMDWRAYIAQLPIGITEDKSYTYAETLDLLREHSHGGKCFCIVDNIGQLNGGKERTWEALPKFVVDAKRLAEATGSAYLLVNHLKTGEKDDIMSNSRQIENIVDFSWSIIGFKPRLAKCQRAGMVDEHIEINRKIMVRKNRHGAGNVDMAVFFNGQTLEWEDHGLFLGFDGKGWEP